MHVRISVIEAVAAVAVMSVGAVGSDMPARASSARVFVPRSALTHVMALAPVASTAAAYVATPNGVYRAAALYTAWQRLTTLRGVTGIYPNPFEGQPNLTRRADLLYVTSAGAVYHSAAPGDTPAAARVFTGTGATVTSIAWSRQDGAVVYAGGGDASPAGVDEAAIAVSRDGGGSWRTVFRLADSGGGGGQLKITALAVDPRDENHVYATYSVYHGGFTVETTNGGRSWTTLSGPDAGTATPTLLAVSAGAAPGAPAEV